jgi:hypothetical protein
VSAIKKASVAAKESEESVTGSEEYKKEHDILRYPGAAKKPETETAAPAEAAAATAETKEEAKEEAKAEAKEEKKEEKAEIKEEKKEEKKDRSRSRKRASFFGNFSAKKEEKAELKEAKKEGEAISKETPTVPVPAAAEASETPAAPVAEAPATEEVAAAPVAEPVAATEPVVEAPATEAAAEARPTPTKRSSIFGQLTSRFSGNKKADEQAPAVPAKDVESSEAAPVLDPVATETPLSADVSSPANVPTTETTVPETNGVVAPAEETKAEPIATSPTTKAEKRKSAFGGLAKRFGTLKGKKEDKAEKSEKTAAIPEKTAEEPKTEDIKVEEPAKVEETPATEAAAPVAPVTEENVPEPAAAHASTPTVSATA